FVPEFPALNVDSALVHDRWNFSTILTEESTWPIEDHCEFLAVLNGIGEHIVDLQALEGAGTVSFSGMQLRAMMVRNPGGHPLRISKAAVAGYGLNIDDSGDWSIPLGPGGVWQHFFANDAPIIG